MRPACALPISPYEARARPPDRRGRDAPPPRAMPATKRSPTTCSSPLHFGQRGRGHRAGRGPRLLCQPAPLARRPPARLPCLGPAGHAMGQRRALRGRRRRQRQARPARAHRGRRRQRRLPAGVGPRRPPLLRLGRDRLGPALPLGRQTHRARARRARRRADAAAVGVRLAQLCAPPGRARRASLARARRAAVRGAGPEGRHGHALSTRCSSPRPRASTIPSPSATALPPW